MNVHASLNKPSDAVLSVRKAGSAADRKAFLEVPYRAYGHLPEWRAPLRFERAAQIDPARNPALARMTCEMMLARRGNEVVGRIAAFTNPAHLTRYNDQTGHFGFLDTVSPDPEATAALMQAAEDWLRARGMQKIAGPFNFSVNEECGLLIEGFETPPVMMMPHGRPDYAPTLESLGYGKAMDMHAYNMRLGEVYQAPEALRRLTKAFAKDSTLEIRMLNTRDYENEIKLILDIFDDAWSQNWGFVPFGKDEITHLANELKPLIRKDGLWIGSIDGEPACFTLLLPNLNEAVEGLDGRLLPFGWAQLLHRLNIKGTRTARLPLAGLRRKYQKTKRGLVTMVAATDAALAAQHARGVREVEASWILESNRDLVNLMSLWDAPKYKTYRIYGKSL
ncbi:hypothetical protein [Hyphomonas sp.]|uniref:hypothetical protein n=1 Tax=Hyphomonas sp. TaxID=87 RepID=UPI0025C0AE56|nr:hypothetical protein [Hyphomonas sp.]